METQLTETGGGRVWEGEYVGSSFHIPPEMEAWSLERHLSPHPHPWGRQIFKANIECGARLNLAHRFEINVGSLARSSFIRHSFTWWLAPPPTVGARVIHPSF